MIEKQERRAEAPAHSDSTKKKRVTQEQIVLNHLRKYGSITSMDAFSKYQITRLSSAIHILRHKHGYKISMTYETSKKYGKPYGRYFLIEEESA